MVQCKRDRQMNTVYLAFMYFTISPRELLVVTTILTTRAVSQ